MAETGTPRRRGKNVAETVKDLAWPIAEELGFFIWDVEFVKEGARKILRITIDNEEGINIEDCERMHRAIDPLLDEADPIDVAYHLEVSSPGLERELKTEEHLSLCLGWPVEVRLYAPLDGAKSYTGELGECDAEGNLTLLLDPDGTPKIFPRASVATIRTTYDFDAE